MWTCTHPRIGIHAHALRGGSRRAVVTVRSQPEPNVSRKQLDDGSILFTFGVMNGASATKDVAPATSTGIAAEPLTEDAATGPLTEDELRAMKVVDLRNLAKQRGVSSFAKLRKDELIDLLLTQG